ncbi:MAG: carbohydrate ABC transporter permease [Actinomycetota bacterium]
MSSIDQAEVTPALSGIPTDSDRRRSNRLGRRPRHIVFVVIPVTALCVIWLIPTLGLLVSSFRDQEDVRTTGWWTVFTDPFGTTWTLDNYRDVLDFGLGTAFINTFVVAIPATLIPILAASFAAYAFAWMEFPGRQTLFAVLIALLVVPIYVALIPILRLYGDLGLTGRFAAVWLAHTGFAMPLAIYLIRNYMGTLPRSIIESARIDGASHFQIFWKLILPLSTPILAAFAILQFLWVWNDFLIALIFLGSDEENQVIQQALVRLIGDRGQDWHLLTAGGFIAIIVPLIVFFALQRYFVRGLTAGSVKG